MQLIPLSAIPSQTLNVVLDGQYCTISVYWRQTRLYLDLTVAGNIICVGRICQNRVNVLQIPVRGFYGTLHFFDVEGDSHPSWEQLGSRFLFLFASEGETLPEKMEF